MVEGFGVKTEGLARPAPWRDEDWAGEGRERESEREREEVSSLG